MRPRRTHEESNEAGRRSRLQMCYLMMVCDNPVCDLPFVGDYKQRYLPIGLYPTYERRALTFSGRNRRQAKEARQATQNQRRWSFGKPNTSGADTPFSGADTPAANAELAPASKQQSFPNITAQSDTNQNRTQGIANSPRSHDRSIES